MRTSNEQIDDYHCIYDGQKLSVEDKIEIGCEKICKCMDRSGRVECENRCQKMNQTTNEQCVMVPDPKDSCCRIELCDVTLDDHEQSGGIVVVTPPPTTSSTFNARLIDSSTKQKDTNIQNERNEFHCERNETKYRIGE